MLVSMGVGVLHSQEPPISLSRLAEMREELDRVEQWIKSQRSQTHEARIEHAAVELERAGRADWAAAIRSRRVLTEIKARQQKIAQLESEIVELKRQQRNAAQGPTQLLIDVTVLEADVAKLRELGFDFDELAQRGGTDKKSFQVVDQSSVFREWFDEITRKGAAKVLSRPKMITELDRTTSFFVGGHFPVIDQSGDKQGVKLLPYGLKISVSARRKDKTVGLEVNAEQSSPHPELVNSPANVTDEDPIQHHFDVQAKSDIRPGEAMFIYTVKENVNEGQKAVLLLIEPRIVRQLDGPIQR
jgi:hypothetical protein